MTKNSKRKLLFRTFLLMLLFSGSYVALIPGVHAAGPTIQEKGLAILSNVVGLDMAKYTVNIKEYPPDSYLGVLPQENVRYELNSNESKLEMFYTFTNGKIQIMHVLENEGSPRVTKTATSPLEMANDFLSSYQSYTGNSFYGELGATLANVDANENLTKTVGNTKLEVTVFRELAKFRWTYTLNGVEAPDKVVALGYENGFLKLFYDSWDLYKIGSNSVNISEEEAIATATARARNYSWPTVSDNNVLMVKNFNVTGAMVWETVFRSSLVADTARNADLLMLYPMRHVWVSLDKFYPGNVYGFNVYVWADTGEVAYIQEWISTQDPPPELYAATDDFTLVPLTAQNSAIGNGLSATMNDKSSVEASSSFSLIMLIGFSVIALLMLGSAIFWPRKKKGMLNRRLSKLGGVLLCLLAFSMLLAATSSVNAINPQGRATIWTSRSMGAYNYYLGFSWRKAACEVEKQEETVASIASSFNSNGYDTSNYHGSIYYGVKERILAQISRSEALYPRAAVVVFDHGNGNAGLPGLPSNEFHYMFEDDNGTRIGDAWPGTTVVENAAYDYEIYPRTDLGKVFFAFINTCNSAHIDDYLGSFYSKQGIIPLTERAHGLPFAFTHLRPNIDMSGQGYFTPYPDDFVYIGFNYGSAALAQSIDGSYPPYYQWVEHFFGYALTYDMSVSDALDQASAILWPGYEWWETPLYQGFIALWPMYIEGEWRWEWGDLKFYGEGWMRVYGNGNMHLYQKGGVWNFDENQGSTAHDSRLNNDGTIYGATWTSGKINSALSFDGLDDYVEVQDSNSLDIANAITIEAWVNLQADHNGGSPTMIRKQGNFLLEVGDAGNNRPAFLLWFTDATTTRIDGPEVPKYGWHHWVGTYDGNAMRLYIDGSQVASTAVSKTIATSANSLRIGRYDTEWFAGVIDEVRIYNYAMSPEQIADDVAVASFHLNGGDNDYHYAYDSSPYGNTGTVDGASWSYGVRTNGVHSLALSFDGSNDYVVVPDSPSLNVQSITISMWVKQNARNPYDWTYLLSKAWWGSYHVISEDRWGTNVVGFTVRVGGNDYRLWTSQAIGNQWSLLTFTYDAATGVQRTYFNGAPDTQQTNTPGPIDSIAGPLLITGAKDYLFNGVIDEVRICDRALSADEIAAYYAANFPRHWLTVWAWNDEYSYPLYPWVKIDGQYTNLADVTRGTHTVEVEDWIEDPYLGWFYFDHFTYGSTTDYNNPMTLSVSKDTEVIAYYNWYGW